MDAQSYIDSKVINGDIDFVIKTINHNLKFPGGPPAMSNTIDYLIRLMNSVDVKLPELETKTWEERENYVNKNNITKETLREYKLIIYNKLMPIIIEKRNYTNNDICFIASFYPPLSNRIFNFIVKYGKKMHNLISLNKNGIRISTKFPEVLRQILLQSKFKYQLGDITFTQKDIVDHVEWIDVKITR